MKKRILITVKTYPYPHADYQETVCTAGVDEDGVWYRLFPIRYRSLPYSEQYKKWDWVEIDIKKNPGDFRPESYHLIDLDSEIKVIGHISHKQWDSRKEIVLKNVHTNMQNLISEAKEENKWTSLAVFKPTEMKAFCQKDKPDWSKSELEKMKQMDIFADNRVSPLQKLPYSFGYELVDETGYNSSLKILDWEIGVLYWNCLLQEQNDKNKACQEVISKLEDMSSKRDLYLFLGTTHQFHNIAPNPFTIIGLFYPPIDNQQTLEF